MKKTYKKLYNKGPREQDPVQMGLEEIRKKL